MSLLEEKFKPYSGYMLFFDNFISPKLVGYLAELGMFCTRTVCSNQLRQQPPTKSNREIIKGGRWPMMGVSR